MTPIDLYDYAKTSSKIPLQMLRHKAVEIPRVSTTRIFFAYLLDFFAIFMLTLITSNFLHTAFSSFMITQKLYSAFSAIPFDAYAISFFPFVSLSYFFFSFFFNRGQSWGMSVMKCRIEMEELKFRSALIWGMISSTHLLTTGLTLVLGREWISARGLGDYKSHDHLYAEFMQEIPLSPVNILDYNFESEEASDEAIEEEYLNAA